MKRNFALALLRGRGRAPRPTPNWPLWIGAAMVAALAACALAAPLLTPLDPTEQRFLRSSGAILPAPYPPGTPGMPLGSDMLWRDMYSRLLHGSRYTLLFCGVAALLRVALGAALGMLAGWHRRAGRAIDVAISAWSAVPSLIFALVPIALVNRWHDLGSSTLAFVLALSLTGWTETAVRCRVAVVGLRAAPFIDAAFALGRRPQAVLWRHVLPNLRGLLLTEAAFSMGATLLLVAELAFLNVVIGGPEPSALGNQVVAGDPIYAEWGSMLARGLRQRGSGIWLLLEPALAFTFAILAFNLLAEGLRRR